MASMPHWPRPPWTNILKKDLNEFLEVMDLFENPHLKLPPVIHVAGTNGKGSTVAILRSIFEASGYKTHIYTSPHLLEFNERIVVSGSKISDQMAFEILERIRVKFEDKNITPTFFEAMTIAAFIAFSENPADIVILETGMGGKLDQTNIVPKPIVSVITPISFDHMEYLGDSIEKIAEQKAGIIKQNCDVVVSIQNPNALKILLDYVENNNSQSMIYGYDYFIEDFNSENFTLNFNNISETFPRSNLEGDHQIINATTAIASIKLIESKNKFKFSKEAIHKGLTNVYWPGRLQKFNIKRIYSKSYDHICYIDGAHNIDGAITVSNFISKNLKDISHKIYIIIGMTKNRNIKDIILQFKDLNPIFCCVKVLSEPSSYSSEILSQEITKFAQNSIAFDDLTDAVKFINIDSEDKKSSVIITGSLYLIADCLKLK